jgi:hypothetical protein
LKEELRLWVNVKNYDEVYEKVRKAVEGLKSSQVQTKP